MRWITGITLNNYRAFGKPESIAIPYGHHLLVYGENGSGKSSIYSALKDFFVSSFPGSPVGFKLNEFEKDNNNKSGTVIAKIATVDQADQLAETEYNFAEPDSGSTHRRSEIQLASKVKGFLDYKRMLQVHALDVPVDKQPNVFRLLVKEILSDCRIPDPEGGTTSVELLDKYNQLAQVLCKAPVTTRKYTDAKAALKKLDAELQKLLEDVFRITNDFLAKYFKNKLRLNIRYRNLDVRKPGKRIRREMIEEAYLRVFYAEKEIPHYHVFLNEARLSALAICLYLASIRANPVPSEALRVLYLDDVFIGLDTSNRMPLLEILRDEFIKQDFQIFISTYDRQWFEVARDWFESHHCRFKAQELYIEDDGNPLTPEYPVVLPSNGNIDKARAYFKAKDYPAAGHCLRKACEAIIKNLLPSNYRITASGDAVTELQGLLHQLNQLYEDSAIPKPQSLLNALTIYRKALLNPSSHDDLKHPIYRREIEEMFQLASQLQAIQKMNRNRVLDVGQRLSIKLPAVDYAMELELGENIYVTEYVGTKTLSPGKYFITKWVYRGIEYGKKHGADIEPMGDVQIQEITGKKRSLEEIFQGIKISIGVDIPADLYSAVTIGTSGSLKDLLA